MFLSYLAYEKPIFLYGLLPTFRDFSYNFLFYKEICEIGSTASDYGTFHFEPVPNQFPVNKYKNANVFRF